jgi:hypothetical protein
MRTSFETSEAAEGVAERMHAVVRALATGKLDVRARLCVAGSILLALQERDFPPELQPLFTKIQRALTHREPENGAGRLQTTS